MVALEDALALVITHPVTRTADLGLVGDHCAGNCAEIDQNSKLYNPPFQCMRNNAKKGTF